MKNLSVTQSYLLCTLKEKNRLASYSMEKGMCLGGRAVCWSCCSTACSRSTASA